MVGERHASRVVYLRDAGDVAVRREHGGFGTLSKTSSVRLTEFLDFYINLTVDEG